MPGGVEEISSHRLKSVLSPISGYEDPNTKRSLGGVRHILLLLNLVCYGVSKCA